MPKTDGQTVELALFALIALAMLAQATVLLATFIAMRKAVLSMGDKLEEMRAAALPLIQSSSDLVAKLAPRIDSASEDLAVLTHALRVQSVELESATTEFVARARTQAVRVDSMLSEFLDAVDRAGGFVAECINKPMRQLSAVLASVKAAIESLRTSVPASRSRSNHAPADNDMFV
jgi:hypothetical protein